MPTNLPPLCGKQHKAESEVIFRALMGGRLRVMFGTARVNAENK